MYSHTDDASDGFIFLGKFSPSVKSAKKSKYSNNLCFQGEKLYIQSCRDDMFSFPGKVFLLRKLRHEHYITQAIIVPAEGGGTTYRHIDNTSYVYIFSENFSAQ